MVEENKDDTGLFTSTPEITERQIEYLESYIALGSASAVARKLNVSADSARESLKRIANKRGLNTIRELLPKGKAYSRRTEQRASVAELTSKLKDQEYRCALSGIKLEPSTCALDHIVPVSSGGSDLIDNLHWVSSDVNRAKGAMDVASFVAMCKDRKSVV